MVIYTKINCRFCAQAKSLLKERNIPYQEVILDTDITKEKLVAKFPYVNSLPIITEDDGKMIGGYTNLIDYLNPKQE